MMQTRNMRQGEQRAVQCVGKVHEIWCVDDREERDGTGRSGSLVETPRE